MRIDIHVCVYTYTYMYICIYVYVNISTYTYIIHKHDPKLGALREPCCPHGTVPLPGPFQIMHYFQSMHDKVAWWVPWKTPWESCFV